jgi:hypothetical protein
LRRSITFSDRGGTPWREKVDQHNTCSAYERIERVIVERDPQSAPNGHEAAPEFGYARRSDMKT